MQLSGETIISDGFMREMRITQCFMQTNEFCIVNCVHLKDVEFQLKFNYPTLISLTSLIGSKIGCKKTARMSNSVCAKCSQFSSCVWHRLVTFKFSIHHIIMLTKKINLIRKWSLTNSSHNFRSLKIVEFHVSSTKPPKLDHNSAAAASTCRVPLIMWKFNLHPSVCCRKSVSMSSMMIKSLALNNENCCMYNAAGKFGKGSWRTAGKTTSNFSHSR